MPKAEKNPEPYHRFEQQELQYAGPSETQVDPRTLQSIRLGWFGPGEASHESYGDLWVAANIAIEEANAMGGYEGIAFELVARWSENPWSTGVADLAKLAYGDRIWALLGSVDGPGTHLAEQVVAKARLPLVSPISTDLSVNLAGVPWMFSLAPADPSWSEPLIDRLLGVVGTADFVLIASTDHDSRMAASVLLADLHARDRGPSLRADLSPEVEISSRELAPWVASKPAALLLVAGSEQASNLLEALRKTGFEGPVFGTPQMARSAFQKSLGERSGPLVYPDLLAPSSEYQIFANQFRSRRQKSPDWAAVSTYDATRMLIEAVHRAGLDRARIRETLATMTPWRGASGIVDWNPVGQNKRQVLSLVEISR